MGVPNSESTSTPPPAQLPAPRSQRRATVYFVYSILLAALSVYNALDTGSFSWEMVHYTNLLDENVVFGISAVLEASGLAFGVVMSIRQYRNVSERSLWGDLLSEPYLMVLEGMFGEGDRGRTLFMTGVQGTVFQGFVVLITYIAVPIRKEGKEVGYGILIACMCWVCYYLLGLSFGRRRSLDSSGAMRFVSLSSYYICFPLFYEVLEAYHLILSGASVLNCTLVVLDTLAIVPLAVVGLCYSVVLSCRAIYAVVRVCCPLSCREYVEVFNTEPLSLFVEGHLARPNVSELDGPQRRASPVADASLVLSV